MKISYNYYVAIDFNPKNEPISTNHEKVCLDSVIYAKHHVSFCAKRNLGFCTG